MADWPDTDELKRVLNVDDDGGDDWTTTLERVLAAAISRVKSDVTGWDEADDEPTEAQAQAALRMAELIATRPNATPESVTDPTYWRLLKGSRRRFAIS